MKLEDLDKVIALRSRLMLLKEYEEAVGKRSDRQKVLLALTEPTETHINHPRTDLSLDVTGLETMLVNVIKADINKKLAELGVNN